MTGLSQLDVFRAIDETWPAAETLVRDGWCFRRGEGGGQRVSAATVEDMRTLPSIAAMERVQTELGQPWLVMIRPGDEAMDAALDARGYLVRDPTVALSAPVGTVASDASEIAAYPSWPPLAVQEEMWTEGGIGPTRVAVMARARGAKTALLGRVKDAPVATAFVAISGDTAMLHALEITLNARRRGHARAMMRAAANWAKTSGAAWLSVLVVKANAPAVGLYRSLGLTEVAAYHYRRFAE